METVEKSKFEPIDGLDDLLSQADVLDRYSWISTKILGRWRTSGIIRAMRGKDQEFIYPQADLVRAINGELKLWQGNPKEGSSNSEANGSAQNQEETGSTDIGELTEQELLNEENSLRLIFTQPKTNSSRSSPQRKSRQKARITS